MTTAEIETWEYVEPEYLSHDAPEAGPCVAKGGILQTITDEDGESGDWIINEEIEPREGRIMAAGLDMLAALRGIAPFADMQIQDLCADIQEGGLPHLVRDDLRRWQAVLSAIAKAEGEP